MNCPYCNNTAEWVENKEIYGDNIGRSHMIYLCRPCGAYVGCHNNTRKPLGTMANADLRALRIKAHDNIDPLWKSGLITRKEVYTKLNEHFGKEIHIGEADTDLCNKIIKLDTNIFLNKNFKSK